jgi:hypothetical protein
MSSFNHVLFAQDVPAIPEVPVVEGGDSPIMGLFALVKAQPSA